MYPTETTKSGCTVPTSKGAIPRLWEMSTTNRAPTDRAASPTLSRSTRVPSVQWQAGADTTEMVSSRPSRIAAVQSSSIGRFTKTGSAPRSVHGYTMAGNCSAQHQHPVALAHPERRGGGGHPVTRRGNQRHPLGVSSHQRGHQDPDPIGGFEEVGDGHLRAAAGSPRPPPPPPPAGPGRRDRRCSTRPRPRRDRTGPWQADPDPKTVWSSLGESAGGIDQ